MWNCANRHEEIILLRLLLFRECLISHVLTCLAYFFRFIFTLIIGLFYLWLLLVSLCILDWLSIFRVRIQCFKLKGVISYILILERSSLFQDKLTFYYFKTLFFVLVVSDHLDKLILWFNFKALFILIIILWTFLFLALVELKDKLSLFDLSIFESSEFVLTEV